MEPSAVIDEGRCARPAALGDSIRKGPRVGLGILAGAVLLFAQVGSGAPAAAPKGDKKGPSSPAGRVSRFETDLLPLLRAKCWRCHGAKTRRADLDLRTPAAILKGGESGPAVVPGQPGRNLLFEKVHAGDMPPRKGDRLTQAEVATVRRWIAAGAPLDLGAAQAAASGRAVTQYDVIPILLRRCTVCHGPRQREGGLDLRTRAAMLRGGKSGPAIVPGKPGESLLIKKIHSGQMPPLRRIVEVSIKPIEPAEAALLARWIELGAPEVPLRPDIATTRPDPLVTDKDRDFWAFRPPEPVRVPAVRHTGQVRNPLDAFILSRLEARGMTLSAEADPATLMRRVYLDLTGLPPEPGQVRAFLADSDPAAYDRMVDRLLASPRYGERWARHWLDLAGYADSEGKREQDLPRPSAWRYRDYVIRSFNADKPYDSFLLEQLAGDELIDSEHAPAVTQEMYDDLVATGFLRMAPDPTWYNLTNFIPDRFEVIADEIDVLGSAVLGLTLKCARCHDHKFDPIPTRDYYRLVAVFKGALDEHDWMKSNWHPGLSMGQRTLRRLPLVTAAERRRWEAHESALRQEIAKLRTALDGRAASLAKEKGVRVGRAELLKLDAGFKKMAEDTDHRIKTLEAARTPAPEIRALWDRGEPSPTFIYRRGDYLNPGRLVGPGVPSVLTDGRTPFEVKPPWPGAQKTGRRLALARWLTRPNHPLTARVLVNRVWKHHFGVGLVKSLDNFGKAGARPTHPELLDWLALEFVRKGWSIKALHRLMVTSAVYRQASALTPALKNLDPDNLLYSRRPLQRLSAEQLADTMLLVAGRLDETPFGPPDPVAVRPDGLVTPVGTDRGWRRGIYLQQQRKVVATHLETFDFPQMNPNCVERRDSTVAPQALHLMNNGLVHQLAGHFARRVRKEAGDDPARQVERVYLAAFGRPPGVEEKQVGLSALARLTDRWARQGPQPADPDADGPAGRALATYCHAILNSAEFLYID